MCRAPRGTAVVEVERPRRSDRRAASGARARRRRIDADGPPEATDLIDVWTRNHLEPILSTTAAHEVVAARVKRMTYQRVGFLAAGRVRVGVQPIDVRLHVPYWAGFFGRRDAASLVVMDAVRRQIEGAKVRRLITAWLAA